MSTTTTTAEALGLALLEGHASTDLSKQLLKKLQGELKDYTRNKSSAGAIFIQSHVAYKEIVGLVKQLNEAKEIDWDVFEKSHKSITGLEAYLLELLFEGHNQDLTLPPLKLLDSLQFVLTWGKHRDSVTASSDKLDKWVFDDVQLLKAEQRPAFKSGLSAARREDDLETVTKIVEEIKENTLSNNDLVGELEGEESSPTFVDAVKAALEKLPAGLSALPSDYATTLVGKVVSGVMLLHIPFVVSKLDGNDAKTDEHIKSLKLWKEAETFAKYVQEFVTNKAVNKDELDEKYNTFKKILETVLDIGPLTPQILSMMRLTADVRRPFYGRSTILVKMWYNINREEALKKETEKTARENLRKAVSATLKALKSAKNDISGFDQTLDGAITKLDGSYKDVHTAIMSLIDKYARDKKSGLEEEYTKAEAVDKEHLAKFRAKITFAKPAESSATQSSP